MAQRKQLTWTELRVGLFVLVALGVLAAGIFYVTGSQFLGPKYRLKTYLPEASGLSRGAPVSVDGVEVGNVEGVRLVPRSEMPKADRSQNVEVLMRIDRNYEQYIQTDSKTPNGNSVASLVTQGLLGNRYVNISRGYNGVPVKPDGVIPGVEEKAIAQVVERSADVLANLQALSSNVQDLVAGVRNGEGTLGKLLTDESAYKHLNSILAKTDNVVGGIQQGQGTLGKLVATDELYTKVNTGVDNVNLMLADIRAQKGTIGKLIYDPAIYNDAKQALSGGNALISDIRAGKGTIGKLATQDELYNNLRSSSSNLATATAKLNENTTTVGKLFNDPRLYDNLAGLTGDMRLLIGDFRQNPKKYLHIKLSIF
jgi:phospholipid/cholesterol/gamma-HCH transport system substrate-binding protein